MSWISLTANGNVKAINAYAVDADADIASVPTEVSTYAAPGSVAVSIESGDRWALKSDGAWAKVGG